MHQSYLGQILLVGLGGFVGSGARFALSGLVHRIFSGGAFLEAARENGLAGATVLRGLEGFGAHSRLHKTGILRLSTDLPIVVEIVDTREKIEAFLPLLDGVIHEGLATLEKVEIRFYRSGKKEP